MEKLTLCYVSFNYYPSQGLVGFSEFPRMLKKLGHRIYVVSAARENEKLFEKVEGIYVLRIPVKTTKRRSLENIKFSIKASKVLSILIKKENVQIIHVFSYAFSFLLKTYTLKRKCKWIYDIRSGPIENNIIFYHVLKRLVKFDTSFYDQTFIIDKAVEKEIFGNHKMKEGIIIPIGVDLQSFKSKVKSRKILSKYGIYDNDLTIVYLGSLSRKRRLENLIIAFSKACTEVGGLRLIIIGDGDGLQYLKLLTMKLSISDRVFFLGYIDRSKIPQLLSEMDVAISYIPIVPYFDAQPPAKTVEYLACSLPVIATATQGNIHFIEHEKNGLLTGDDPDSVSKAIVKLCLDVNFRQKLAENARSSIIKYDWGTIVIEKILPAYCEVLQN